MTTFYYEIEKLVGLINHQILIAVKKRTPDLDGSVADDDETTIKDYLGEIATDVFSKHTSPLGRGLADLEIPEIPFEYDVTYDPAGANVVNSIVYRVEWPTTFDTSTVPAILKSIEETLVSYCVWQWLMDNNIADWEIYEAKHTKKKDNLIGLINRRVGLRRTPGFL